MSSLICIAALLAAPTAEAAPLKVAVFSIKAQAGIGAEKAELFSEFLQNEIRSLGHEVLGKSEITAVLEVAEAQQALDCDNSSCMAELAGALGVDQIVHGVIGKMGPYLLLTLKRINQTDASVLKQVARKFEGGGDKELLEAIAGVAQELFADVPSGVTPAVAAAGKSESSGPGILPITLWGVGGVSLILAGVFEIIASEQANKAWDTSLVGGQLEAQSARTNEAVAIAALAVGLASAAGGLVVWLLTPNSESSASVGLMPLPTGAALVGRF